MSCASASGVQTSVFGTHNVSVAYSINEKRLLRAIQSAQIKLDELETIVKDLRVSSFTSSGQSGRPIGPSGPSCPSGPSGSVLSNMTKGTFSAYQILEYAAQHKCNELMAVDLIDIHAVHSGHDHSGHAGHAGLVTQQIWTLLNAIKHVELMPYSVPKEHECIRALRSQQPLGIKQCRAILADFYHNYFVYREVFV